MRFGFLLYDFIYGLNPLLQSVYSNNNATVEYHKENKY